MAVNVSGWLAPDMYECTACGYIGRFYIEVDSEDFQLDEEENSLNLEENDNNL